MQIPVTQFADTCLIPRPTFSQILSGRNKKISDEVISKIHAGYPRLSMIWLLFGEGVMLLDENIKTSGPQKTSFSEPASSQGIVSQPSAHSSKITEEFSLDAPNNFALPVNEGPVSKTITMTEEKAAIPIDFQEGESDSSLPPQEEGQEEATDEPLPHITSMSLNPDQHKRIVNIIVYYSDNSFESFVPSRGQ